jgi:exopolysaccharide production repressor protein
MSFLLFLRGLIAVLIVFAIASYAITQSPWTTFIQTLICAVLIQVGYFAAVLFLVWRSGAASKGGSALSRKEGAPPAGEAASKGEAPLPGVRRSPLP